MSDMRRVAAVLLIAATTIVAAVGAAVLFLLFGLAGLIVGACLVAASPVLGVMVAKRIRVLGEPFSRVMIVFCVWAAVVLAICGLPVLGVPLSSGDAFGSAVTVGIPILVVLGAALGVFCAERDA